MTAEHLSAKFKVMVTCSSTQGRQILRSIVLTSRSAQGCMEGPRAWTHQGRKSPVTQEAHAGRLPFQSPQKEIAKVLCLKTGGQGAAGSGGPCDSCCVRPGSKATCGGWGSVATAGMPQPLVLGLSI